MHRLLFTCLLSTLGLGVPCSAAAECGSLLPAAPVPVAATHAVTARDLIELVDIGDADSSSYGAPGRLALSPDGRQVAFSLLRADIATDTYCLGIVVSGTGPGAEVRQVAVGGEVRIEADDLRGFLVPSGALRATVPVWSPDGRSLAYLRRDHGVTQVWTVQTDGSGAGARTRSDGDVEAVAWSADGQRLIVATYPDRAAARTAVRMEGKSGWLYDQRIAPDFGAAPLIAADTIRSLSSIDVATGGIRPATAAEAAMLPTEAGAGAPLQPVAVARDGRSARTVRLGTSPLAPLALVTTMPGKPGQPCRQRWCRGGITGLWWDGAGSTLYVLRREGWDQGENTLYRWSPGDRMPRLILRTTAELRDCLLAAALVCTSESALSPRRIVAIDVGTGVGRSVFDPNPQFAARALGTVQRLKASNALGLEAWADLVLPPGYRAGTKLPLVVTQYHSDGFLRGGTGDEYPVFLLAARGFAVLSFERPPFVATAYPNAKSAFEINAIVLKDWAERRSIFSSLSALLDRAIATGTIDPARIGITGLSDGASTIQFALVNSHRFAAAATSTCCFEPQTVTTYSGLAFADYIHRMGFPSAITPRDAFWRPMSIALAARQVSTPLLMQLADREYLGSLETFTALREAGKPVELYVFPDEYHVKWQPRHRLTIYERNLDWFDFWLRGERDPVPTKAAQYGRWEKMRNGEPSVGPLPRPRRAPRPRRRRAAAAG